jgi:predicted ATPase
VIGRESVIDALAPQLAQRGPLTIVGPGGIGKSTVALALAHARQADYQHGVCFVDLAPSPIPPLS